jgi:hypothetical protein
LYIDFYELIQANLLRAVEESGKMIAYCGNFEKSMIKKNSEISPQYLRFHVYISYEISSLMDESEILITATSISLLSIQNY